MSASQQPHEQLAAAAIPEAVLHICRRLQEAGFPCVLVGGAVRDLLRGRRPQDWDLASAARPEQVQALFERVIPTGIAYGTVTVLDYGIPCQVTSFRREGRYEDGRHPAWVETGATLEEDLSRRDFTINAMAYDPVGRRLIDPFGGRADLAAGVVRTVGSPDERFQEDALRILRALRIVSEEGFTLHPDTEPAITRQAPGLRRISGEREGAEMLRLLMGRHVKAALDLVLRTGLLPILWPAFAPAATMLQPGGRLTVYEHTARAVHFAPRRVPVRLAALGHDWGKVLTRTPDGRFPDHHRVSVAMFRPVLRRWRVPQAVQEHVLALIRHHMFGPVEDRTLRRWIGRYGRRWVLDLIDLREADARASEQGPLRPSIADLRRRARRILREEPVLTPDSLALNGHDIMALLGLEPGPEVGRWKEELYRYVLEDPARNTREALTAFLLERAAAEGRERNNPRERDGDGERAEGDGRSSNDEAH